MGSMKNVKAIEGFGIPGAGKSTCISMLKNDFQFALSIDVFLRKEGETRFLESNSSSRFFLKKLRTLNVSLFYLIMRPKFFLSVLRTLFIFKCNKHFTAALLELISVLSFRSKMKTSNNLERMMVLDEGLIQYVGSLVVNTPTQKQLPNTFIKHIISNYISGLIYFDLGYEAAIQRIKKRNDGKSRFDRMANDKAIFNLKKMEFTFLQCITMAENLDIPILILEKENSAARNVGFIENFLNTLKQKNY